MYKYKVPTFLKHKFVYVIETKRLQELFSENYKEYKVKS